MKGKQAKKTVALPSITPAWVVFFLVWPFGALIRALRRFRAPQTKTIIWLFCIFFGFVFVIPEDVPGAADSARYARQLIDAHNQPLSWSYLLSMFYNPDGGFVDIYQPLVTWLVAIFTGNPRILMAIFGAVFGFFYAQNLWMVFSRISSRVGWLLFFFMLAFSLVNPIWNINGVRMWTAAQVFLYSLLRLYLEKDRKGLIWAASSILVHFSFMFPFALLLIFRFIPTKLSWFFAFYVGASFVNEINLEVVRNLLGYLPEVFQSRMESYTGEAYFERRQEAAEGFAWHVTFAGMAGRYARYAWIIAIFVLKRFWSKQLPDITKLFALALFVGGFAQIASLVPSGGRFMVIANSLLWAVFILIIGQNIFFNKLKVLKLATLPLLGFSLIFSIRVGMDYFGISAIVSNPLFSIFLADQVPLIQFVKQVF
jgi:hypothetical protein